MFHQWTNWTNMETLFYHNFRQYRGENLFQQCHMHTVSGCFGGEYLSTHSFKTWSQGLSLSAGREPDCWVFSVCSENKRQFYAEIPWVIVGTDKMFLGTWRTRILEHSPKDSWEPKHRELTSLNDSFWKIYSELNKTLITYNFNSQRRT